MNKEIQIKDYLQTLKTLKERVLQAQYNSYSAVNSEMILAYLDIGKVISEKTKTGWGTSVIKQLSKDLQAEFPVVKGFSDRNLRLMRFVYEEIADAEQIIYVEINKKKGNKFNFESGAIEEPSINKRIVEILEGTMPAFNKRRLKYYE